MKIISVKKHLLSNITSRLGNIPEEDFCDKIIQLIFFFSPQLNYLEFVLDEEKELISAKINDYSNQDIVSDYLRNNLIGLNSDFNSESTLLTHSLITKLVDSKVLNTGINVFKRKSYLNSPFVCELFGEFTKTLQTVQEVMLSKIPLKEFLEPNTSLEKLIGLLPTFFSLDEGHRFNDTTKSFLFENNMKEYEYLSLCYLCFSIFGEFVKSQHGKYDSSQSNSILKNTMFSDLFWNITARVKPPSYIVKNIFRQEMIKEFPEVSFFKLNHEKENISFFNKNKEEVQLNFSTKDLYFDLKKVFSRNQMYKINSKQL